MDGFIPSTDGDEFLNRLVAAASRFFGPIGRAFLVGRRPRCRASGAQGLV
jgi:hypothetical protein